MIVSLFNKLMTPTKKEEEPATRVEVQQLGEEVYVFKFVFKSKNDLTARHFQTITKHNLARQLFSTDPFVSGTN